MIPFVWSDDVLAHEPLREVTAGKETPGTEVPYRAQMIRDALLAAGHDEVPALRHDDDVLLEVHEPAMVEWLRGASAEWAKGPYEQTLGQDRVVPSVFPTPMMTAGMPWKYPAVPHAQAGVWCYDTGTPIGPGTWQAARGAVDVTLTATALVADGARAAYALTRPPGHHAGPAGFGGSCYLNNAAVAAQSLARRGARVAVVDLDAHHGNGTQAVFWQRADVFYGSVHVDPAAGFFPHVLGHADETGAGEGAGTTLNVPLPPGCGDVPWIEGIAAVCEKAIEFLADVLIVSLGVDGAITEPDSPLGLTEPGFAGAGRLLASLETPTVLVQEGGRHLPTLGDLVAAVLAPFDPDMPC